jgi:hypothetical protein
MEVAVTFEPFTGDCAHGIDCPQFRLARSSEMDRLHRYGSIMHKTALASAPWPMRPERVNRRSSPPTRRAAKTSEPCSAPGAIRPGAGAHRFKMEPVGRPSGRMSFPSGSDSRPTAATRSRTRRAAWSPFSAATPWAGAPSNRAPNTRAYSATTASRGTTGRKTRRQHGLGRDLVRHAQGPFASGESRRHSSARRWTLPSSVAPAPSRVTP